MSRLTETPLELAEAPGPIRATVARGAAVTMVLRVSSIALALASALILARALGTAQYGTYAWAFAAVNTLALPAMFGTDQLLTREVAVHRAAGDMAGARGLFVGSQRLVMATSLAMGVIAALVLFVVWGFDPGRPRALAIALPMVPFLALLTVQQGALQGVERFAAALTPNSLVRQAGFLVLVAIGVAVLGSSFSAEWALVLQAAATLAGWVVGTVLIERALPRRLGGSGTVAPRGLARSGLAMGITTGVMALDAQVGLIVLGTQSAHEAGLFAAALQVSGVFLLVHFALRIPMAPVVARLHRVGPRPRLQRAVTLSTRGVAAVSAAAAVPLLVAPGLVLSVFGADFEAGANALRLLVVAYLVNGFAAFNGLLLIMTGHVRQAATGAAAALVLNLILCLVLVPAWGIEGAAAAALASFLLRNVLNTWQARQELGVESTALGLWRAKM